MQDHAFKISYSIFHMVGDFIICENNTLNRSFKKNLEMMRGFCRSNTYIRWIDDGPEIAATF